MAASSWFSKVWEHRRRLSLFVLVCGVMVVGMQLLDVMPHETQFEYRLGPRHHAVEAVTIRYFAEDEEAKGVRFEWRDGAPERLSHEVELYPGSYEIRVTIREDGRDREMQRRIEIPAEGLVRIDLFNVAHASAAPQAPVRELM